MHLRVYSALCGLTALEHSQLEKLFSNDRRVAQVVERSSRLWRKFLLGQFPDHLDCRRAFLAHSIRIARECGMDRDEFRALATAFVLALGDIVERRVLEEDIECTEVEDGIPTGRRF